MRLLIITQKVDRNDPILGFFHRWLAGFATRCDQLIVIGQLVGAYDLPSAVTVHSLGKEKGKTKWQQIRMFWRLIRSLRHEYDVVFVHMTPVWVVLGGILWKAMGKRIFLWYEVKRGGGMLQAALVFVNKVFSATRDGLPFLSAKQLIVGHGIDTAAFCPDAHVLRERHFLLTVGRMTPVKHYEIILDAVAKQQEPCHLLIAGGPILSSDLVYEKKILEQAKRLGVLERLTIRFHSESELIHAYRRSSVFLHACGGGLDKVLLEAMACECPVISCSEAARNVLPEECTCTEETMGEVLRAMLEASQTAIRQGKDSNLPLGKRLRQTVVACHSLATLLDRLVLEMK